MQNGPMYNFNGYYIFAIPFCFLLIFAGILSSQSRVVINRTWRLALIFAVLSSFLVFNRIYTNPPIATENIQAMEKVDIILNAEVTRDGPKLILFGHDNWSEVAGLALALRRKGIPFYVKKEWNFMFGKENILDDSRVPPSSVWEMRPQNVPHEGFSFICNTSIAITPIPPSLTLPMTLVFSKKLAPLVIVTGFSEPLPESWGRWTVEKQTSIHFFQPLPEQFFLTIEGWAFGPNAGRPVPVTAGNVTKELTFAKQRGQYTTEFNNVKNARSLIFEIPQPASPLELNLSDDPRKLGLAIDWVLIFTRK